MLRKCVKICILNQTNNNRIPRLLNYPEYLLFKNTVTLCLLRVKLKEFYKTSRN